MAIQKANTPKNVVIRIKPRTTLWEVYFDSGGELPKSLSGGFTSKTLAQRAVDNWRNSKNKTLSLDKKVNDEARAQA